MISFNLNRDGKAMYCSKEQFELIVSDPENIVREHCKEYQTLKPLLMEAKMKGDKERAKELEEQKNNLQYSHPVFCYLGTFAGDKRNKESVQYNGLAYVDIDLKDNPEQLKDGPRALNELIKEQDPEFYNESVVLSHVTWSGTGLRYIFKADHSMTYLENIEHFVSKHNLVLDESCKDLSRLSFAVPREYILKLSDELFTYNNPMTNAEFGGDNDDPERLWYGTKSSSYGDSGKKSVVKSVKKETGTACLVEDYGSMKNVERNERGEPVFKNIPFALIAELLMARLGGVPDVGERNTRVNRWAWHFRAICDNDAVFMADIVRPLANGLPEYEIEKACRSAVQGDKSTRLTRDMKAVLRDLLPQEQLSELAMGSDNDDIIDYDYWVRRMNEFKLPHGMKELTMGLPANLRVAGIIAALPCLYTLLTRIKVLDEDEKLSRLNGFSVMVGPSSSGKSLFYELSQLLLGHVKEHDQIGRDIEEQWKKERERKGENGAMKTQHPEVVVQYMPTNSSVAEVTTRLTYTTENVPTLTKTGEDGEKEKMHLHLMTVEPDMATLERVLSSGHSNYSDFMLKAFGNEEAGSDFKYNKSTNGIVNVYWNFLMCGVWSSFWSLMNKFDSGLERRLMIFPMPNHKFRLWEKSEHVRTESQKKAIRELAEEIGSYEHPFFGNVVATELVNEMDCWMKEQAELAKETSDEQRFQFCLRDRKKGFMAGVAFAIIENRSRFHQLRNVQLPNGEYARKLTISKNAKAFARFVADFCIETNLAVLANEIEESRQKMKGAPTPWAPSKKGGMTPEVKARFDKLPDVFTIDDVLAVYPEGTTRATAQNVIHRWECISHLIVKKNDKKNVHQYMKIQTNKNVR